MPRDWKAACVCIRQVMDRVLFVYTIYRCLALLSQVQDSVWEASRNTFRTGCNKGSSGERIFVFTCLNMCRYCKINRGGV